jgi:hypothetical protein
VTAAAAAKRMNPAMKITVYETPVGPDTENLFDDAFWGNLDGVCNALDNIKAREYSDSMLGVLVLQVVDCYYFWFCLVWLVELG